MKEDGTFFGVLGHHLTSSLSQTVFKRKPVVPVSFVEIRDSSRRMCYEGALRSTGRQRLVPLLRDSADATAQAGNLRATSADVEAGQRGKGLVARPSDSFSFFASTISGRV